MSKPRGHPRGSPHVARQPSSSRKRDDKTGRAREIAAKPRGSGLLNYFPSGENYSWDPSPSWAEILVVTSLHPSARCPPALLCIRPVLVLQLVNRYHQLPLFFVSPLLTGPTERPCELLTAKNAATSVLHLRGALAGASDGVSAECGCALGHVVLVKRIMHECVGNVSMGNVLLYWYCFLSRCL